MILVALQVGLGSHLDNVQKGDVVAAYNAEEGYVYRAQVKKVLSEQVTVLSFKIFNMKSMQRSYKVLSLITAF